MIRLLKKIPCSVKLVCLLVLLGLPVWGQEVAVSSQSYLSRKKPITVERFATPGSERRPAVILLYGASGLTRNSDWFRDYAHSLAREGFVTFLVHYFDATGSETAGELPVSRDRFELWYKALEDGISFVGRDPQVDARHIGLLGVSLGAYLALWDASQDSRVKAVVEYYGSVAMFLGPARRMPPTLILHGEKDAFVPVAEAHKVEQLLKEQHAPYEIRIYPDQGHGFDDAGTDVGAAKDALNRSIVFFRKHLSGR